MTQLQTATIHASYLTAVGIQFLIFPHFANSMSDLYWCQDQSLQGQGRPRLHKSRTRAGL